VLAEAGAFDPFVIGSPFEEERTPVWMLAISVATAALLTLVVVIALYRAIAAPWETGDAKRRRVPTGWLCLTAILVALALVGQDLEAARRAFATRAEAAPFAPHQSFWDHDAGFYADNYGFSFLGSVISATVFLALSGLLATIRAAGRSAETLLIDTSGWLVRVIALLYAGFVVGTGGVLPSVGVAVPVAFAVALVAMLYLPRPRLDLVAVAKGRDVEAEAEELRQHRALDRLRRRQRDLSGQYAKGALAAEEYYTQDRALVAEIRAAEAVPGTTTPLASRASLSLGPGTTWWDNVREAVRWGALLAVVPLAYYLYVFFSRLGSTLAFEPGFRPLGALVGLAAEVAFWLVGSITFGALLPHLPGRNGIVKALSLWSVYLVASLVAVVAAHEHYNAQWSFRAFEFLLFLIALGVTLDWKMLGIRRATLSQLLDYYQLRDVRAVATYAAPVILSTVVIAQQLLTGEAHDAIISIIKNFSTVLPQP
jgi:hypothetical protein